MPPQGEPFQTATVEIVADMSQLKAELQQAKAEVEKASQEMTKMGDAADDASAKAASGFQDVAIKLAATITVIISAVDAFVQLYDKADDFFNGKGDFNLEDSGKSPAQRIAALRKELNQLRQDATDRGLLSRIGDAAEFYTGTESGRTRAMKRIAEIEKQIANEATTERRKEEDKESARKSERMARDIAREQEASLQGVDRIIAERNRKIADAQKQYGKDADPLVRAINDRAESEINRFKSTQAEKARLEDQARKEREQKEKESAERVAKHMAEAAAKAMSSALSSVSAEFQNVFNSQLGQMSFTIEGLAANVEKIANQRRAAG